SLPSGWDLTGLSCSAGGGQDQSNPAKANISLAAGQTVTCTYTNTKPIVTSSIVTEQSLTPSDAATVTGQSPTGSVNFRLFSPSDVTCSGTPAFAQIAGLGGGQASTSNTSFVAKGEGTWRWLVEYEGDANNVGSKSHCGVENFSIVNGG